MKAITRQILRNRWLLRLIGLGLFVLILFKIDLGQAWQTLTGVDPFFVILSLHLQAIGLVVATLRWQLIMGQLGIHLPFSRAFAHQLIGTAAALVTPGQLGEFVKVLYHRQEGFPVAESLLSVLIDRLYDLLLLLFFGFIALAILFGVPPALTIILVTVSGLALGGGLLLARRREANSHRIAVMLVSVSPKTYRATMERNAHRLAQRIGAFKLTFLINCALLTGANYIFLLFRIYALVLALHLVVPFWYFALIVPLLRLVGLIPVSISGIGTRDITAIYLLGQVGVPQEAALIVSVLGLITLQVQALVGVVAWWRYPLHLDQTNRSSLQQLSSENEISLPGR